MTTKRTPIIEHTQDRDGARIVRVSLANCQATAKLFEVDYEALRAEGITDQWCFNHNGRKHYYVRAYHSGVRGQLITIARKIAKASCGIRVLYADGDRLNLRADNLRFDKKPMPRPVKQKKAAIVLGATPAMRALHLSSQSDQAELH
jgi:hypothetical protein